MELVPYPEDVLDQQKMWRDIDNNSPQVDAALKDREERPKSPERTSNVAKAKRIRNLARMKVRDTVQHQDNKDTNATYNLGGHVSTFLNR